MKKIMKNKNGITLVALVITIIILLILAGITIAQLTGSGLFENARLAEEKYKESQEKENQILSEYESLIGGSYRDNKNYDTEQVDEWSTWLHLAGIDNPGQYNKHNIVEDESLMNILLNNDAAVDYMVESKYFILPAICRSETAIDYIIQNENARNKVITDSSWVEGMIQTGLIDKFDDIATKVPTSSTTTENMLVSSDLYNVCYPYNAFDDYYPTSGWNDSFFWIPQSQNEDSYIGYNFNEPVLLYKFSLHSACYGDYTNQYSFVLQGLNQDGSWENIGDEYMTDYASSQVWVGKDYYISNNKKYYGYRIKNNYSVSGNGHQYWHTYGANAFGIGELQFYCVK